LWKIKYLSIYLSDPGEESHRGKRVNHGVKVPHGSERPYMEV